MLGRISSILLCAAALTAALPIQAAHADRWYWVPSQITNGDKGRAILSRDPNGPIGKLLGSLGMYWSHSGMFIDRGYDIRHNTADPDKFKVVNSSGKDCSSSALCVPDRFNGATLSAAQPGLITQGTNDAFGNSGHPEFYFYDQESNGSLTNRNGAVLLRRNVDALGGSLYYITASDQMTKYEAMYSFYSYTDIWTTEPDASDPDHIHVAPKLEKRNMCSGTVAWALFSGGGFSMWPWYYADSVRNPAASVLYRSIYDAIGTKSDSTVTKAFVAGLVINPLIAIPGAIAVSSINSSTKDRMANQFVNCMAFNDCYNTTSRWKNGVGAGNSLSPDNLVPIGFTNLNGKKWGMSGWNPQDTRSLWYDSVEGISYTGGYWKKY